MTDNYAPLGGRRTRRSAVFARISIWAFLATHAVTVVLLLSFLGGARTLSPFAGASDGIAGVSYVVSVVAVSVWIYRAHQSLFDHGFEGLEFTPGWSVGWFFVPFACLFKPLQAMKELWNVSAGDVEGYTASTAPLLSAWWGSFIIGNMLLNLTMRQQGISGVGTLLMGILATAVTMFSAVCLMRIINRVTLAQTDSLGVSEVFA